MPKASPSKAKYDKAYGAKPAQKKRRAARNTARARAMKEGKVSKGDGKDIDHKNKGSANGKLSNKPSNLRVKSASANRADNRGRGGRKKK